MCSYTFGASVGGGELRSLLCLHFGQLYGISDVFPIPDIVYISIFFSFWTFLRLSIYTILKIHDCISWCNFFYIHCAGFLIPIFFL